MKKREKDNYILSGIAFIIVNIIVFVLIYTRPEIIGWDYILMLFIIFVVWFFTLLSFPFMKKTAGIKIFSEKRGMFLIMGVLVLFIIVVFIVYYNISDGKINIILLSVLGLFCIGIINIIKGYLKFQKKKKHNNVKKGDG